MSHLTSSLSLSLLSPDLLSPDLLSPDLLSLSLTSSHRNSMSHLRAGRGSENRRSVFYAGPSEDWEMLDHPAKDPPEHKPQTEHPRRESPSHAHRREALTHTHTRDSGIKELAGQNVHS